MCKHISSCQRQHFKMAPPSFQACVSQAFHFKATSSLFFYQCEALYITKPTACISPISQKLHITNAEHCISPSQRLVSHQFRRNCISSMQSIAYHQANGLYIINFAEIAYHQCRALHITKPTACISSYFHISFVLANIHSIC